jgi:membrane-associated phospholipid phosphatase
MLVRNPIGRIAWALYPALVMWSVVATGNHWVLDVIAGALALVPALILRRAGGGLAVWRGDRAGPRQPRDARGHSVGA